MSKNVTEGINVKLLIAGNHEEDLLSKHDFRYDDFAWWVFYHYPKFEELEAVVQGAARGIDTWAKQLALAYGVACGGQFEFKAEWKLYGPQAGPIRNGEMVDFLEDDDQILLFWNYHSKGTKSTRDLGKRRGISEKIVDIREKLTPERKKYYLSLKGINIKKSFKVRICKQ